MICLQKLLYYSTREYFFCKHVQRWVTNNAHKIDKVELILYAVDLSKGEEVTCKHRLVCVDVGL